MADVAALAARHGLVEIHYTDAFSFLLDYARQISHGVLSTPVMGGNFNTGDLIDVEIYPPQARQPIKIKALVAGRNEPIGHRGKQVHLDLDFSPLEKSARLQIETYLDSFKVQKTCRINTRRKQVRYSVDLAAAIHSASMESSGRVIELSQGGAHLETGLAITVGQRVGCIISLPGDKQLFIAGRVLTSTQNTKGGYSFNIKFEHFEANSQFDLDNYLEGLLEADRELCDTQTAASL